MDFTRATRTLRASPALRRRARPIVAAAIGLACLTLNCEADAMKPVRPSALAGSWYAADPAALAADIDARLARARSIEPLPNRPPVALIAPHAGHAWSGDAAAQAYRLLMGEAGRAISRVILLGPAHTQGFRGASLLPVSAYETPLGPAPLDTAVVAALLAQPDFHTVTTAHAREHCLEIQLPFLQRALAHDHTIVPILIGRLQDDDWPRIAAAIAPHIDERTLVVVSSDFTHYGERFGYLPFRSDPDLNLRRLDLGAIAPIVALDPAAFSHHHEETGITVCGVHPIGVLLELLGRAELQARWGGPPEARVLDYVRSADRTGDFDGSVSYAAIAFFRPGDLPPGPVYPALLRDLAAESDARPGSAPPADDLAAPEKAFLLDLARRTIIEKLSHHRAPRVERLPAGVSAARLGETCGVFVTLHRDGRLRGCIGSIEGREPLQQAVITQAISAALHDPRFAPVRPEEIGELEIEISVLTPLRRVQGPAEIEIGRHGVVLERGKRRAVFLPQVAPEQGWDRETMLSHLARKAGLPPDGWRTETSFWVFEALVFEEPRR